MSKTKSDVDKSLCKHCVYRIERTIIPTDEEVYPIDRDELDIEEGAIITLTQNICVVLDDDLESCIVVECNKFTRDRPSPIFMHNPVQ